MERKENLGVFMQTHEHYAVSKINKVIINPLLEKLIAEFSQYDDFLVKSFVRKDNTKNTEINYFQVKPNRYPKYFCFEVQVWFEKGDIFIKNDSLDVFKKLQESISLKENTDEIEVFNLEDAFKIDYLATVIIRMFINYYEQTSKQNNGSRIIIEKGLLGF
jgi:hypothetical protein